jgi:type II secretory pathway pseudopilin PulG
VSAGERGLGLLEVVAALAILSLAGLALLSRAVEAARATQRAALEERALAGAERLLIAHVLLGRRDLDRRLGAHEIGELVVSVQRPRRDLYRIAVSRMSSPDVEQLATVVRRAESGDAP